MLGFGSCITNCECASELSVGHLNLLTCQLPPPAHFSSRFLKLVWMTSKIPLHILGIIFSKSMIHLLTLFMTCFAIQMSFWIIKNWICRTLLYVCVFPGSDRRGRVYIFLRLTGARSCSSLSLRNCPSLLRIMIYPVTMIYPGPMAFWDCVVLPAGTPKAKDHACIQPPAGPCSHVARGGLVLIAQEKEVKFDLHLYRIPFF